jgi:hypothetical protein
MTCEHLQQLAARLDGQGFEARIISGRLFVIAPPAEPHDGSRLVDVLAATSRPDERGCICYNGERRRTEIITCAPREDDGNRSWFFDAAGQPLDEAGHITDAAMRIGSRLAGARASR